MLITRECDYAVRVIRALNGETRLSVNEICEREDITAPFAYKILKKLQKAGIVTGYRGVHGGYALSKDAQEFTLLDIYNAIDPDMFIIECLNPHKPCTRNQSLDGRCLVHQRLSSIQDELCRLLDERNMAELFLGDELQRQTV